MSKAVTMNDRATVDAGLVLKDEDGQEIGGVLPEGATSEFVSSDEAVAQFAVDETGLHGTVSSGAVGTCTITGRVLLADGRTLEDTLEVTITHSEPASAEFVVGTPTEET